MMFACHANPVTGGHFATEKTFKIMYGKNVIIENDIGKQIEKMAGT